MQPACWERVLGLMEVRSGWIKGAEQISTLQNRNDDFFAAG